MKDLMIDPELKDLLPPLTDEEYKRLEKNILENGFDKNFPIMEWHGYIADGHNRYSICRKHNIEPIIGTLAYNSKEEVMRWMLDIQLGRRNLIPIQRIAVAEKYRPIYERQAKERQAEYHGNQYDKKSGLTGNLPQVQNSKERNPTTDKILSDIASVSEKTYRMGAKVLNSDNEDIKQRVLSGEISISAGYKELMQSKKEENINVTEEKREIDIKPSTPLANPTTQKPIIENGAILLSEESKENKNMNAIAKQMKSDSENSRKKVQTDEIKNDTAYREIKQKDDNSPNKNPETSYKDITSQYAGTQRSGHFGEYFASEKTTDKTFTEEDVIRAYKDTKTTKNALDKLDITNEFNILKNDVNGRLETYKNRLFNVYHIQDKISDTEREYANRTLNELIDNIKEIINLIKGEYKNE